MRANFYTLDFKKKIFLCLFLVVFAMVGLDVVLYIFSDISTSKTNFVNSSKVSKAKHFELNDIDKKDLIFVGSTRTLHHISTNFFAKNNISIYNFGVSGNFIGDYPFITKVIKKVNVKKVIFSIKISDLFEDYAERGIKIYTNDELVANFGTSKLMFFRTLPKYFTSFHLFLRYSEAIYNRLNVFYNIFESKNKIIDLVANNERHPLFNVETDSDCNVNNILELDSKFTINKKLIVAKCTNGDSILFANALPRENYGKVLDLKELKLNTLKYMQNYIIDPLAKNGVKVVVLFEPIFDGTRLQYNINEITSAIKNAKIVDLTNLKFSDEELSDPEHLNYLGRKRYSEFLVKLYLDGKL